LQGSTDKLIGFFDIQQTNVNSYYQAQTSKQASWDNFTPVLVDTIHHGLTLMWYWLLALAISAGSYTYSYNYIVMPSPGQ
jgi:hypothetical protein